jgi:hypothetical protein
MQTVLYNLQKNKIEGNFREGYYLVDGKRPVLNYPIIELEVIIEPTPEILLTQKLEEYWEIENNIYYKLKYNILNKTQEELLVEDWQFLEYSKRIVAPDSLIFEDAGIKMFGWFSINNFPIKKIGNFVRLYCNTILPQHQDIVDMYAEVIIVEDRPNNINIL